MTVICDISKQIEQRVRIGKIFATWHLALAMTVVLDNVNFLHWSEMICSSSFGNYLQINLTV